jgi:hypothetical protein
MFDLTPEEVSKEAVMASGRTVKDVIGYKDSLKLPVGYLSLDDNSKLCKMIKRNAGLLTISYPTPTGDKTQQFIVEPPTYTTFDYDDEGVAIWKGVTISAKTLEVVAE